MASGSLGCAHAISGRGTGLTLGPESMPPTGANHGWRLGCAAAADGSSGSDVRWQRAARRFRRVAGKAVWCGGEKCRCAAVGDGGSDE